MFLHAALSLSVVVAAQSGAAEPIMDAEAAYYGPYCEYSGLTELDVTTVAERLEAPAGGAFWLRTKPEDTLAARVLYASVPPRLRDGAGDTHDVEILRETTAAVAIAVPEGAVAGETYLLHREGDLTEGVVLKVVSGDPAANATVGEILEGAPEAAACTIECYDPYFMLPRAGTVAFPLSGAPVIVDAWEKLDGTAASPYDARLVDSRLVVPTGVDDDLVTVRVGQIRDWDTPATLIVEVRNPDTAELLATTTLDLVTVAPLPVDNSSGELMSCDEYYGSCIDYCVEDDYYGGDCACTTVPSSTPVAAAVVVALGLVVRRRRR